MFFKWGISFFDSRLKKYGGFNHFIAGKIFRWRLNYFCIGVRQQWHFGYSHNSEKYYYDGYHNYIQFGCLQISYGT